VIIVEMQKESIYNPEFVSKLFDSMSSTYGLTNYISSFGFTERWRKACISKIKPAEKPVVIYDLMSGMGELWPSIKHSKLNVHEINAVDISPNMNSIARKNKKSVSGQINILEQDILKNDIESNSADHVVSSFGLKTFNTKQLTELAHELNKILKPEGSYSFVEISVPNNSFLKFFYMFYLTKIIPVVGYLFQGNSQDYKMLGTYTSKFGNSKSFHSMLLNEGLESHYEELFFGCGSITWGKKKKN
tara:strand:- start:133443 stop:134180 length:738 start_codon:yes stop_codon:yes gene_type:complete